jgi:hypothetical protein
MFIPAAREATCINIQALRAVRPRSPDHPFGVAPGGHPASLAADHIGGSRSVRGSHPAVICGTVDGRGQSGRRRRPDCLAGAILLLRRCRWRRCRWRAGRVWCGRGRSAWWCAGRRGMRPLARRGAGLRRRNWAAVTNACRSVCGPTCLVIPTRRVTLRTIRAAPWLSSRLPSPARKSGPSVRSPMARSTALAVRRASGIVTTLPPSRVMTRVRCPRSRPMCPMSAPVASDTRSPLSASRTRARRPGRARRRPGARRPRYGLGRWRATRSPAAAVARALPGIARGVLPRRRTCRTRRWCTAAG